MGWGRNRKIKTEKKEENAKGLLKSFFFCVVDSLCNEAWLLYLCSGSSSYLHNFMRFQHVINNNIVCLNVVNCFCFSSDLTADVFLSR